MILLVASLATYAIVTAGVYVLTGFDLYVPGDLVLFGVYLVVGFGLAMAMGGGWRVGLATGALGDMIWHLRALLSAAFDYLVIEVQKASNRRTR